MDGQLLRKIMWNWGAVNGSIRTYCPPEAKIVTGRSKDDALLHYFQLESGTEITLTQDFKNVEQCVIVDPEKFMMFALKWS